jgi:hypothetical protein
MKCIHCGRTSLLRERTRGRCPGCGHRFAFDPAARTGPGTDAEFQEAIDRVSGGGRLWFTARQLWLAANGPRTMPPPPPSTTGPTVLYALGFALPGMILALFEPGLLIMAVLGGVAGAVIGGGAARDQTLKYADQLTPRLPFNVFLSHQLTPWQRVHGDIPGLLPVRGGQVAGEPLQVPADMAALGVDRVVVTDRWQTARMLVANRFHLQHRCAVLSRDGYPKGDADTIKAMLRRTPRLTVFALHDASIDGCQLPLELREPEWFPDPSVRMVDLGLRPETVMRLRLPPIIDKDTPSWSARLGELLPYEDRQWLDVGNVYELAALPPEQLMRAVYEGMVAAGPNDGSGGTPAYDDASWNVAGAWFSALSGGGGADTAVVAGSMRVTA